VCVFIPTREYSRERASTQPALLLAGVRVRVTNSSLLTARPLILPTIYDTRIQCSSSFDITSAKALPSSSSRARYACMGCSGHHTYCTITRHCKKHTYNMRQCIHHRICVIVVCTHQHPQYSNQHAPCSARALRDEHARQHGAAGGRCQGTSAPSPSEQHRCCVHLAARAHT